MEDREPEQIQLTETEKDMQLRALEERVAELEQEKHRAKRRRRRVVVIVCVSVVVLFAAAVILALFLAAQDKESPAIAEAMLQAMLEQDVESAYALLYPGAIDREECSAALGSMYAYWFEHGGGDTFTLKRVSWSMNTNPASSRYETEFLVRSGDASFDLHLVRVVQGESAGVVSFNFS